MRLIPIPLGPDSQKGWHMADENGMSLGMVFENEGGYTGNVKYNRFSAKTIEDVVRHFFGNVEITRG